MEEQTSRNYQHTQNNQFPKYSSIKQQEKQQKKQQENTVYSMSGSQRQGRNIILPYAKIPSEEILENKRKADSNGQTLPEIQNRVALPYAKIPEARNNKNVSFNLNMNQVHPFEKDPPSTNQFSINGLRKALKGGFYK